MQVETGTEKKARRVRVQKSPNVMDGGLGVEPGISIGDGYENLGG